MSDALDNIFLPIPSLNEHRKKWFQDLGKATRRGIRKCHKCGVINGTKGTICKNKECDAIFRDCAEKRRSSFDGVQLISDNFRRVYSVRVREHQNQDLRGFVQLPAPREGEGDYTERCMLSEVALCFVDSCQRLFHDSILKCHENDVSPIEESNLSKNTCCHITAAVKSSTKATPIEFNTDIIKKLNISFEIQKKLWYMAKESRVPIVQRVSKFVMAVKCDVSPKYPLGYLHFVLKSCRGREILEKYSCSCSEIFSLDLKFKCIHYYACICALASDPKLSKEFASFINLEIGHSISVPKEKTPTDFDHSYINTKTPNVETKKNTVKKSRPLLLKKGPKRTCFKIQKCPKISPKIFPVEIKILNNSETPNVLTKNHGSQSEVTWSFSNWLTSVVESVNNTMNFENFGIMNTLVFHAPKIFYKNLRAKIPEVYFAEGHQQNENLDYELVRIMNISHLKQIFDTNTIKLQISKRFVQNEQNSYVELNENLDEHNDYQSSFIYFLNVGQLTVDESDNTNNSFFVEWIPNIFPISEIGQIKFQYKYGRKLT